MGFSVSHLNQKQIEKLSDIASDLGIVGAASVVIPAFLDKPDTSKIIIGALVTVILWIMSLWLRR